MDLECGDECVRRRCGLTTVICRALAWRADCRVLRRCDRIGRPRTVEHGVAGGAGSRPVAVCSTAASLSCGPLMDWSAGSRRWDKCFSRRQALRCGWSCSRSSAAVVSGRTRPRSWPRASPAIVSIAADAIISIDEPPDITMFNDGAEAIFGYSRDEVIGQPLAMLLPRASARAHAIMSARSAPRGRRHGAWASAARSSAGARMADVPAEASISKLDIDGRRIFTAVLRDITERKHAAAAARTGASRRARASCAWR